MPDRAMTGCSRALLAVLAVLAAGGPAAGAAPADDPALAVHRAALVLDAHCDLPPGFATPANDPGVEGASQIDLPKLDRGAVDAVVLSVFAWQRSRTEQEDGVAVATGREKLEAIRRAFPAPRIRIADRGLREGILLELMRADRAGELGV